MAANVPISATRAVRLRSAITSAPTASTSTRLGYAIAGGGNVLTLYGPGGPINVNTGAASLATISARVAGTVGLTVVGRNAPNGGNLVAGTLSLTAANTYSGGTTVTGATLIGNPQASGSPFSSGAIALNGAILELKSVEC